MSIEAETQALNRLLSTKPEFTANLTANQTANLTANQIENAVRSLYERFGSFIGSTMIGHFYKTKQSKAEGTAKSAIIKEEKKRLFKQKKVLEKRFYLITLFIKTSHLFIEVLNGMKDKAEEVIDSHDNKSSYGFNSFLSLTDKALSCKDIDRFLNGLFKRLNVVKTFIDADIELTASAITYAIEREGTVLTRLEFERKKTLKEMKSLWEELKLFLKPSRFFPI